MPLAKDRSSKVILSDSTTIEIGWRTWKSAPTTSLLAGGGIAEHNTDAENKGLNLALERAKNVQQLQVVANERNQLRREKEESRSPAE